MWRLTGENTELRLSEGTYCQVEQHLEGKKKNKRKDLILTERIFKHLKEKHAFDI